MIQFQTTAHSLSLILGLLGTASAHMRTYIDSKGLGARLDEIFRPGGDVDFLAERARVFAWNDRTSPIRPAGPRFPADR